MSSVILLIELIFFLFVAVVPNLVKLIRDSEKK